MPKTIATPAAEGAIAAPRGCTHLKLKQASRVVARHYETHVSPTGLRNMQYSLLSHAVLLGPVRAGDLAAAMKLDASTLSRNLQPLLDRGLLEVQVGDDARSRIVNATAAGRELRQEGQRAWKRAQLALNARLGEARVAALHALLDECIAVMDDAPAAADVDAAD